MENKKYFKTTKCSVKNPIKPGDKNVKVEWLFEDLANIDIAKDSDDKYAVKPGCGCTANVKVTDTGIIAYYSDSTSKKDVLASQNREKVVGKNMRVFLDDGKPLYVKNERGIMKLNVAGKANILLTFDVIVQA